MSVKELKDMLSVIPDDFEVGMIKKEDHRVHNLHPECLVNVFYAYNNCNVDLKNKQVVITE